MVLVTQPEIFTLYDRCLNIVSEEEDRQKELDHIEAALTPCGYPKWSFRKVMNQIKHKKKANYR